MEYLRKFKKYIIETAPSYEKLDDNVTLTSKLLKGRKNIGFTRVFYPGAHIEGELKYFERRHKTHHFKYSRLFGGRGEIIIAFFAVYMLSRGAKNSLEREKIDELLCDRDTFYVVNPSNKDLLKIKIAENSIAN